MIERTMVNEIGSWKRKKITREKSSEQHYCYESLVFKLFSTKIDIDKYTFYIIYKIIIIIFIMNKTDCLLETIG